MTLLFLASTLLGGSLACAVEGQQPPKRARPPRWSADVLDAFFENAREKLEGERPDYAAGGDGKSKPHGAADAATAPTPATGQPAWSKLIDAATVETEIKRLAQAVAGDVSTASAFKGGKYQDCRRHFSVLAVLFAVASEYDGQVRWQDAAAGWRDALARAGRNCKAGTDQTYREATERNADLAELVAGARPSMPRADRAPPWSQIADRPPLMERMNIAHQERLTKWTANEREFAANHDEVRHEAQLVAAIANVIARDGFDYWDDEQFAEYARELRQAATDLAAGAEQNDYATARDASARITKACADCHEGYRG
jgi:hypothetical protein